MNSNTYEFNFLANGFDYFKICIVNYALTLITFGIYSPWAKVRSNQYIYSSLNLNNSNFEYTANPVKILLGRAIILACYVVLILLTDVFHSYLYASIMIAIFVLLIPWFLRQALKFKMRYTRYNGINFRYTASLWEVYGFCILHVLLNIITLFIVFPYTLYKFKNLIISKTAYGNKTFQFNAKISSFYFLFLKYYAILIFFILAIVLFFVFLGTTSSRHLIQNMSVFYMIVVFFVFISLVNFSKAFYDAWLSNLIYNAIILENFSVNSQINTWQLGTIYLTNFLMILFSLGLLYPYSKIRLLRYKFSKISISGNDFDNFININTEQTRALGEETADFFDIEIGI